MSRDTDDARDPNRLHAKGLMTCVPQARSFRRERQESLAALVEPARKPISSRGVSFLGRTLCLGGTLVPEALLRTSKDVRVSHSRGSCESPAPRGSAPFPQML